MDQIGITLKVNISLPAEYVMLSIKRIDQEFKIGDWVKLQHWRIDLSDLPPVPIVDVFDVNDGRGNYGREPEQFFGIVIPRQFKTKFKKLIKCDDARRGQRRNQVHREMIKKHEGEHKKYFIGLRSYLMKKAHPTEVLANIEYYS